MLNCRVECWGWRLTNSQMRRDHQLQNAQDTRGAQLSNSFGAGLVILQPATHHRSEAGLEARGETTRVDREGVLVLVLS